MILWSESARQVSAGSNFNPTNRDIPSFILLLRLKLLLPDITAVINWGGGQEKKKKVAD